MAHYQIDWRREFAKLGPYLGGKRGIVHIRYRSADCAPNVFNAVLKQRFHDIPTNERRISLRIDDVFFTTHTADDILSQIEAKLALTKPVAPAGSQGSAASFFSGLKADGDITINVMGSRLTSGGDALAAESRPARTMSICRALQSLLDAGGRILFEVNDASHRAQNAFWALWRDGFGHLVGDGLVLIYMIGPEADHQSHPDAPAFDTEIFLPQSFEMEDERQDHVYDDLFDLFMANGLSSDSAASSATVHLNTTKSSVSRMHGELAGVLMALKMGRAAQS